MRKWFFLLLILFTGFGLGFSYKQVREKVKIKKRADQVRIASLSHPILEDKPFVIITMSYNNSAYCEKNLLSILEQDYKNYRVFYIDDCSTDDTFQKVQAFLSYYDKDKRVTLIRNEKNKGAMENLYQTVHRCQNNEIVVVVDGDDFLSSSKVLSRLNGYYANPEVWLTYGDYVEYPSYDTRKERKLGACLPLNQKMLKERGARNLAFITSHLRTFYAGLFKRIKHADFLYDGDFFQMGSDVASMIPMVELAGDHAYFINDILYIYNTENPASDYKKDLHKQSSIEKYVRSLPPYPFLKCHPKDDFE